MWKKTIFTPIFGIELNYYYQYLKYKSDEDLFFENHKSNTVIGFSELKKMRDELGVDDNQMFLEIFFHVNNLNYDLYERTYK